MAATNWLNMVGQVIDAAQQAGVQFTIDGFWGLWTGRLPAPAWFQQAIDGFVTAGLLVNRLNLDAHVLLYSTVLLPLGKVVVVAHSQGNFYANEAYAVLATTGRPNMAIVAVASPADNVADGSQIWITLSNDVILGISSVLHLPQLPANMSNHCCPN